MFAMVEVVVSLTPSLISALASLVYNRSLASMPGAWTLLPIAMFMVQYSLYLASFPLYLRSKLNTI